MNLSPSILCILGHLCNFVNGSQQDRDGQIGTDDLEIFSVLDNEGLLYFLRACTHDIAMLKLILQQHNMPPIVEWVNEAFLSLIGIRNFDSSSDLIEIAKVFTTDSAFNTSLDIGTMNTQVI